MEKEWIQNTLDQFSKHSKSDIGTTRLAYSSEDLKARQDIIKLMTESGLTVRTDSMGNIIARLEGADPQASAVATGSHLDTVPQGGNFDGVVGVVGGLAAIRELKNRGPLTHPLELIVFMAEESSRFGFATMGSKAMVGKADIAKWKKAKDKQNITFDEALKSQGFSIDDLHKVKRSKDELKAFIEMHIEQGRVLEEAEDTIGVVEAIAAPTRLKVTVKGMADHSGATPMYQRKDALTSAAELILAVEEIAVRHSDEGTVGTVGMLNIQPGAMNVVPGEVTLWVDIRGVNYESIIEVLQEFKQDVARVADERDTLIVVDMLSSDRPVPLDETVISTIEEVCQSKGIKYRCMNSGAGHDAMNIAEITPTGMIFIPCRYGISHNPEEFASIDDIVVGVEVLADALYKLAK